MLNNKENDLALDLHSVMNSPDLQRNLQHGTASSHCLNSQEGIGEVTIHSHQHQGGQGHTVPGSHHQVGTRSILGAHHLNYLPQ